MGILLAVFVLTGICALTFACSNNNQQVDPPGNYENVTFISPDNLEIHGRLFGGGEGKPGVILAHMFQADQRSFQPLAEALAESGFMALTFDFRGYGRSEEKRDIEKIHLDIEGAVKLLQQRGVRGVDLIGAGMGATASLKLASKINVLGVATLSAFTDFQGLEVLSEMSAIEAPVLFITSEDDDARHDAAELFKVSQSSRLIEVYRGGDHGTELLTGEHGDQVRERLFEFIGVSLQ